MSAAVVVLATRGYHGASVDAIAQQAGVSKGLLWHYFSGRDELMVHTAQRTLMTLRRAAADLIDLTAPAPAVIRAAIHAATSLRDTHGDERRAIEEIAINLRTADGESRLTLRDYDEMYVSQEQIFRRGQDEGSLGSSHDPRVLAVTYQGAVDAMLGYLDSHPDTDPETFADGVADVLLEGFRRQP